MTPSTRNSAAHPVRRHRPRKRFGQHFLAPTWAAKLVKAIDVQPGDILLEIGPGTGALTLPLAATGAPMLAVEIDRDLARDLATRVPANVTVFSGDILTTEVMPLIRGLEPQRPMSAGRAYRSPRFRVVGNLPYNIASPIMLRLLELQARHGAFFDATVMVQREVADRMLAKPRSKDYGVLTILLSLHTGIERVFDLPPGAFSPPPKVRSTVVRLTFGLPRIRVSDVGLFERLVKAMFGRRRKTLNNAIKGFAPGIERALVQSGLDGRRRPETLQVEEIARLVELVASLNRPPVL